MGIDRFGVVRPSGEQRKLQEGAFGLRRLKVRGAILVAAVLVSVGCERKSAPTAEWIPSQVECQNLVADLGHYGHPDYVVRYFGPPTPDAGMLEAPQIAQRLLYSAIVHRCVSPPESEQWLKTAICMTRPNSILIEEAREQIRKIRSELDGGATIVPIRQ